MTNRVPILMYHQVSPQPVAAFAKYTVTPQAFAAQMTWLRLAGYTPITLDALLAYRRSDHRQPRRPVVITFDDGFQGCVEYAVPILQAKGFTAAFYLVAGLMGKTSAWLAAERGVTFPLMDWATARRLLAAGFQCGAHTLSHPRLANLDAATCHDELWTARRVLADQLGLEVRHLAYPFGSFNERVRTLAAETGYHSACSVEIGFSTPEDDPLALRRIPVNGQDSLLDFICRLRTAYPFAESWRSKTASLRRQLRTVGGYSTR